MKYGDGVGSLASRAWKETNSKALAAPLDGLLVKKNRGREEGHLEGTKDGNETTVRLQIDSRT